MADWEAWIQTIGPLQLTEEELADLVRFREEFRRFNIDAVHRQMGLGEGA